MPKLSISTNLIASTAFVLVAAGTSAIADPIWDGIYAGGAYNLFPDDFDGNGVDSGVGSIFAGYNQSLGSVVVGAEVSTMLGSIDAGLYSLTNTIDLKTKVGTTFGNALVYGIVGYTVGSTYFDTDGPYDFEGMNYGAGADYLINDNLFVGVNYLVRTIDDGTYAVDEPLSTVSIRLGYNF